MKDVHYVVTAETDFTDFLDNLDRDGSVLTEDRCDTVAEAEKRLEERLDELGIDGETGLVIRVTLEPMMRMTYKIVTERESF